MKLSGQGELLQWPEVFLAKRMQSRFGGQPVQGCTQPLMYHVWHSEVKQPWEHYRRCLCLMRKPENTGRFQHGLDYWYPKFKEPISSRKSGRIEEMDKSIFFISRKHFVTTLVMVKTDGQLRRKLIPSSHCQALCVSCLFSHFLSFHYPTG